MAKDKLLGRPSSFSQEIADDICLMIANSSIGLSRICDKPNMPAASTVFNWLNNPDHSAFLEQYTRAREAQAEFLADEIIEIADDSSGDMEEQIIGHDKDGEAIIVQKPNKEFAARSRLKVDARKWKASKLAPKKYGDKLDLTSKDEKIHTANLSHLSYEELQKLAGSHNTGGKKGASKA